MAPIQTSSCVVEKIQVFFDDLDANGAVCNGRFSALVERGLASYLARLGMDHGHEDLNLLVRQFHITFERPVTRVGEIELAFEVERLGTTSATIGFFLRSDATVHARQRGGLRVRVALGPR